LQTGQPLPWTPRNSTRQAPPLQAARRFNQENQITSANLGFLKDNSAPQHQGQTYDYGVAQIPYPTSGMKVDNQWPIPGFAPTQIPPHQGSLQQSDRQHYNAFNPQPGMPTQHLLPFSHRMPEPHSDQMPTPIQTPPPQTRGSCCLSQSERATMTPIPSDSQHRPSQVSDDQYHHGFPQPQYSEQITPNSAGHVMGAGSGMPPGRHPDINFRQSDKYVIFLESKMESSKADCHLLVA